MPTALLPVSRATLAAGAVVAAGLYVARDTDGVSKPEVRTKRAAAIEVTPMRPLSRPMPTLTVESPDELEEQLDEAHEEVRGHATIESIAEFAMVFQVDGTTYMRLADADVANARGKARMIVENGYHAVVAPVSTSTMPSELAKWHGKTVFVNGSCEARVVGFAEVSRVTGDPPGTEEYWYGSDYDEDYERPAKPPEWTVEAIVDDNVMLAAKLDGCAGSWARSTEYAPAQIARSIEASDLETAAIADLMKRDELDPEQHAWEEMGGQGDWQDAVDSLEATSYEHPATGEKWIFVQAYRPGGCGDAEVSHMAAYRVGKSGNVYRFTELDYAGSSIEQVIDLDGDGQPELLVNEGTTTELIDLTSSSHASISIPVRHYGCGC